MKHSWAIWPDELCGTENKVMDITASASLKLKSASNFGWWNCMLEIAYIQIQRMSQDQTNCWIWTDLILIILCAVICANANQAENMFPKSVNAH